jgi:3-oxoadipate enol-lactonase
MVSAFQVDDQELRYEDAGGEGPAVIFSHAFGTDGSLFGPQVAEFGERWRCITWDQRAHGGSYADHPYSMWDSARDLLALLDHLDIERAALVGTSQGGFVSLRAALIAPERVGSLAILGSSAAAEAPEQREAFLALGQAFASGGASGPPEAVLDAIIATCFGTEFDSADWRERLREWPEEQVGFALSSLVERDDIVERLGEVQAPVLVMHGSEDGSYSPSHGRQIADGVPNSAGFVLVDGGAHFLSATDPGRVNEALQQFIPAQP